MASASLPSRTVAPLEGRPDGDVVLAVEGLRKAYGEKEAVRGIDLEVRRGEIFTFLGPNGAGKTTTVEVVEGYRDRDAGQVTVLGRDPAHPTRMALEDRRRPADVRRVAGADRAGGVDAVRALLPTAARRRADARSRRVERRP
jgi:ABC-type Mn2+/Zn2+ transport system ATPase subunit